MCKHVSTVCQLRKGSLVQRKLSAKLTEGLTTPPGKIKDFAHLPLHRGGFGAVPNLFLSQQHIGNQHQAETDEQCISNTGGVAVVSFGNHFVTDDVEHGAAGKCQGKG